MVIGHDLFSVAYCVVFVTTVTLFCVIDVTIANTTAERVSVVTRIFSDAIVPFACLVLSILQTPKVPKTIF